jgi:PBS lyase HEAT-like repeat-containing protein
MGRTLNGKQFDAARDERTSQVKEFTMEKERTTRYQPPVERLLTYGESDRITPDDWPDYRELGIGPEHIPELIQMATDEELNVAAAESAEVWAPLHAWRALGQLRAVEAVEPLLELFDRLEDDDWVHEELPVVFSLIGPAALPPLAAYLADLSHTDSSRISAISSMEQIGKKWPDAKAEALAMLEERLSRFEENESDVNAFLVEALVELGVAEAAPLIERAFAQGYVDPMVMGDWEDVQVELGLKSAEEVATKQRSDWRESPLPSPDASEPFTPASSQVTHKQKAAQKKARSKMARLSRKKNRKR